MESCAVPEMMTVVLVVVCPEFGDDTINIGLCVSSMMVILQVSVFLPPVESDQKRVFSPSQVVSCRGIVPFSALPVIICPIAQEMV